MPSSASAPAPSWPGAWAPPPNTAPRRRRSKFAGFNGSHRRGRAYRGPHARVPSRDLHPRGAPATAAPSAAGVALAAGQTSQDGGPVRLLGAVVVPEEETCFWLYQAPSAGAVRAAMTRAGLRPEWITQAVSIRPPDPALAPRARATAHIRT